MDRYSGLDHYVDGGVPGLLGHLASSASGAKIRFSGLVTGDNTTGGSKESPVIVCDILSSSHL